MNYPAYREYPASESRQTFPNEWLKFAPDRNQAIIKAEGMTDEQRYQEGFRHGMKNRGLRGSLSDYPAYLRGFGDGRKRKNDWSQVEEF